MSLEDIVEKAVRQVISELSPEELYELATSSYQDVRNKSDRVYFFESKYLRDYGRVAIGRYSNGSIMLRLVGDFGRPLATVTAAWPGVIPGPGNVLIKNYSENEGLLPNLIEHGIVGPTIRTHLVGEVEFHECKLLIWTK